MDRPLALVAQHRGAVGGRDEAVRVAEIAERAVDRAQRFRRWYRERMLAMLRDEVDVILAPATPTTAPLLGFAGLWGVPYFAAAYDLDRATAA